MFPVAWSIAALQQKARNTYCKSASSRKGRKVPVAEINREAHDENNKPFSRSDRASRVAKVIQDNRNNQKTWTNNFFEQRTTRNAEYIFTCNL